MTPIFPEVSADLARAADRTVRFRTRRLLPIIGGGLSVMAAAGVATAATGVWHPQIGDERRGTPAISASAVPQEQLALLGVLRRPAVASDRDAEVQGVLKIVGREYRGVRTNAVRRLAPTSGSIGAPILIPAAQATGIDDALCLHVADPGVGTGSTCFSTDAVRTGSAFLVLARPETQRGADTSPSDEGTSAPPRSRPRRFSEINYFGLVPDGVSTVSRVANGVSATTIVKNNLFHIRTTSAAMVRSTLTWRNDQGAVLKSVPGP